MPKIIISQLSSYLPGVGYGSDIIMPNVPEFSGLTRLNVYGSNYTPSDNFGVVEFIDSLSAPPAGISMGAAGLVADKNTATTINLSNISETTQGTMFMLFTLGYDGGPSSSDRGSFITSVPPAGRLAGTYRYRNKDNGMVDPFIRAAGGFTQITSSPGNASILSSGTSETAIKFGNLCMSAFTKNIADKKATGYSFTDEGVYGKSETSIPSLAPAGATVVNFGNSNGPGPITLHAIGYYDSTVLTDAQIQDLWLAMRDTVTSARD